jgi:DNA replication and repair protein RecF
VRLHWIELREFRSHRESRLALGGEPAVVLGENGSGKSNLIEAIVLLSLGRSFRGARDMEMACRGAEGYELKAAVTDRPGAATEIGVRGGRRAGRVVTVNGEPLGRLTDLLGRFPTVHFSVDDVTVLNAGPASRRRFLDVALCQLEPAYVGALREYATALRARNRLLGTRAGGGEDPEIEAWEEILARTGLELDHRRAALSSELTRALDSLGAEVDPGLRARFDYAGPEATDGWGGTTAARQERLARGRARDRRIGWTSEGPHRARPECRIGGEELLDGASRGFARIYSILLRLALARVFEERRSEPPLLLLDDPESELDRRWIGRLLRLVPEESQAIVTACREPAELPGRFRRIPIGSLSASGAPA